MAEFEQVSYCQDACSDANTGGNGSMAKQANAVVKFNNPNIPENRRDERTYVHLCWIYMWCGTLWQ